MCVEGEETETFGLALWMLRRHLLIAHYTTLVRTEARVGECHLFELLVVVVQGKIVDGESIARNETESRSNEKG